MEHHFNDGQEQSDSGEPPAHTGLNILMRQPNGSIPQIKFCGPAFVSKPELLLDFPP
jgi:hypothetical protein